MIDRHRAGAAVIAGLLHATTATAAEAPRYRNFELAIYCRVDDVRRMAEGDWLENSFDALAKDLKVGKVYLETHRSRVTNDRETMLKAKRFFESRGVRHVLADFLICQQRNVVHAVVKKLTDFWIAFGRSLLDHLPLFHGGTGSLMWGLWCPGKMIWLQEDAAALLSPDPVIGTAVCVVGGGAGLLSSYCKTRSMIF